MARTVVALVVAALVSTGAAGQLTGAGPVPERITAEELAGRLVAAKRIAEEAASAPAPSRMDDVRAAVGLPLVVIFAEGDELPVAADGFLASLAGDRARDFRAAAAHLDALAGSLRLSVAAAPPDRARVRADLVTVYRGLSPHPGIRDRILRTLGRWLRSFLDHLGSFQGAQSVVAWLVVVALLIAALWLVSRLNLVPDRRGSAAAARAERIDWRRVAREALARGDEPEAARAHYRALLEALAARRAVPDSPSLTAGECRSAVAAALPDLSQVVSRATGIFERVAYGRQALRPGDLEAMRNAEQSARAA